MSTLPIHRIMLLEALARFCEPRLPEPDLVMDDPAKVAAYTEAGRVAGVMAPVYLYHGAQICAVVRPGDTVLDLGCGPATQLALVASLNLEARFIGVDLSAEMLQRAREHAAASPLANVAFVQADISALDALGDASADAIVSTMALHHLPDSASLRRLFGHVARILKPGGGLYLVDFGRLKSRRAMDIFANQYADRQPELFTLDYLNSLRAAFSLGDFRQAVGGALAGRAALKSTFLVPYMVAVQSPPRGRVRGAQRKGLMEFYRSLPPHHRRDFRNLKLFFRLGGVRCPI